MKSKALSGRSTKRFGFAFGAVVVTSLAVVASGVTAVLPSTLGIVSASLTSHLGIRLPLQPGNGIPGANTPGADSLPQVEPVIPLFSGCGEAASSQVFLPWADPSSYILTDGGSFDDWDLGAAQSSSDHDPFSPGAGSISLAEAGAQAISPPVCVNLLKPTIRLFVKDAGGDGSSRLRVSVLYDDARGATHQLTVANLRAGQVWQPSSVIPIVLNDLAVLAPGGATNVSFGFQATHLRAGEAWTIDGLYVDPFCSV